MKVASKYKVCKRLGSSVYEKCQTQKYLLSESRTAKNKRRGRGQGTDFGRQLIEKQRLRFTYGVSEKQFSGYVKTASAQADPQNELINLLESRLDNVVYRAGLASTRRQARQLVSHGHVCVNGRKVTVPSLQMSKGMKFSVREGSKNRTYFEILKNAEQGSSTPAWINFDRKAFSGEVTALPTSDTVDIQSDLTEVFSYYSR